MGASRPAFCLPWERKTPHRGLLSLCGIGYNVFVVKRTCTAAPRFLRHETGMMPVASPTKICKSRYFSTEAGALQKDLQGKGDAHEQYRASLHPAFHCIDAFHGILRYAQVKAKPPCSWRYIGGLCFIRLIPHKAGQP